MIVFLNYGFRETVIFSFNDSVWLFYYMLRITLKYRLTHLFLGFIFLLKEIFILIFSKIWYISVILNFVFSFLFVLLNLTSHLIKIMNDFVHESLIESWTLGLFAIFLRGSSEVIVTQVFFINWNRVVLLFALRLANFKSFFHLVKFLPTIRRIFLKFIDRFEILGI